jgi:hypothetical protein
MRNHLLSYLPVILLGIGLFLLPGCGPGKGTPVSGTVVLPPTVKLVENDSVDITFAPADPSNKRSAKANFKTSDLSFTANSVETTGILPGKYKVIVKITPYQGMPGNEERTRALDTLINKKFDQAASPLSIEIPAGSAVSITLDLAKGTATKN